MPEINRRSFLKVSAGITALSAMAVPKPAAAWSPGKVATLIDLSLCDGCAGKEIPQCVSACRQLNRDKIPEVKKPIPVPFPRKTVEDWSEKRDIADRLTPYNFIYVHKAEVEAEGRKQTVFVPRRCMHCDNPACATICPFSANHKHPDGSVTIDQDLCFGGAKCKTVCPWEIPQRQSGVGIYLHILPTLMGNGVMYKCDLCHGRLVQGKTPACIEACPKKAMLIGPRNEIDSLARERARAMNGFIYGREENGGTSTLYVSPVSFEAINKTMEKKPGRPGMQPGVPRQMARTDTAGKLVLTSPVLGAAVAAGTLGWLLKRKALVKKRRNKQPKKGRSRKMNEKILSDKGLVERHDIVELSEHWAIALSGLALFVSGMFELPMANRYYLTSIPGLAWSGDFITSLQVHYAASIIFISAAVFHVVCHGFLGDRGLVPAKGDVQASILVIRSFFGKGEEPPFGKYLPEQRLAYAGMAVVIGMLIISGMIKTVKNVYMPDMNYTLVLWATWVHNIFFVLFMLSVAAHLGALVIKPNRPLVRGILTGRVRLDYARRRHPLWMNEMKDGIEGPAPAVSELKTPDTGKPLEVVSPQDENTGPEKVADQGRQ